MLYLVVGIVRVVLCEWVGVFYMSGYGGSVL